MRKLKIINRSGMEIQLAMLIHDIQIGEIITIEKDKEHNYAFNPYLQDQTIRLDLPHEYPTDCPCIYLNGDFMEANMIAYVRKGDGDCWFVDPVRRGAKLVRKLVCNSTHSRIALAEFVMEQIGETRRVPGKIDRAAWTAWWEIEMPSRTKNLLIVDPVNEHRKYFGREGGLPLFGNDANVHHLTEGIKNKNIHEIKVASQFDYVKVKKESSGRLLELTYHRGLYFWSKLSS